MFEHWNKFVEEALKTPVHEANKADTGLVDDDAGKKTRRKPEEKTGTKQDQKVAQNQHKTNTEKLNA